jgi:hypothetical protein
VPTFNPQAIPVPQIPVPFNKKAHIAKIVLGSASLICSSIIIGLGIYFVTGVRDLDRKAFEFAFMAAAVGLQLINILDALLIHIT